MTLVCYAFVYVFESLIALMFFGNKFTQRIKSGFIILSFMVSAAIQFGINLIGIPNLNLASFVIFNFLLCFLCYESKVTQAIFNSLLLAAIMLITELVTVYVSRFVFGIGVTEHTSNDMLLMIQSGTAKLLYFLTAYLISKFATKESRSDLKNAKSALLLLLPIASIVVLLGIVRITELYATTDNIYILFSIATILLMYANITVFWVHESLIKTQRENTELQLQAQKAELDTEYYTLNDCDGIELYIDNLYSEYDVKNIKKYSNNKLVNAIINRYAKVFSDCGITFNCDIRNIDFSFIADNDLTSLLDNLLENALEASRDSEEKKYSYLGMG